MLKLSKNLRLFFNRSPKSSSNFRVCLLSGEYPPQPGGVADYTRLLAAQLTAQGFEVAIVTRSVLAFAEAADETPVYKILPASAFGFRATCRLFRHLRQHSYNGLIFQYVPHLYGWAGIAPLSGLIPLLARSAGVPLVVTTFHEVQTRWDSNAAPPPKMLVQWFFQTFQAAFIIMFSHKLITTNPVYAKKLTRLARRLRQTKICEILPVGSNLPFTKISKAERAQRRSRLNLPEMGGLLLVALSPFTTGKDAGVYRKILEEMPNATLVLLGGIPHLAEQSSLRQITQLQTTYPNLQIWLGPLPAPEISGWLQVADIYLHPAFGGVSGRSGTLAAALQHGLAVIAYDGPETDPRLVSGQTIMLVQPGHQTAFLAALKVLGSNPAGRDKIGANAVRYYQEKASWEINGAAYARILKDVQNTLPERDFGAWRG